MGTPLPPPALHEAALLTTCRPRQVQVEAGGLWGEGGKVSQGTQASGGVQTGPPHPQGSLVTLTDSPANSLGGWPRS